MQNILTTLSAQDDNYLDVDAARMLAKLLTGKEWNSFTVRSWANHGRFGEKPSTIRRNRKLLFHTASLVAFLRRTGLLDYSSAESVIELPPPPAHESPELTAELDRLAILGSRSIRAAAAAKAASNKPDSLAADQPAQHAAGDSGGAFGFSIIA